MTDVCFGPVSYC